MRAVLAALAFAGALHAAQAAEPLRLAQAGTTAADVARAKRCAPPFGCKNPKPRRKQSRDVNAYLALIDVVAADEGVPPRIARALVKVESGFRPDAVNRSGGTQYGLTQIKCRTARGLGFAESCAALLDPETNLRFGLRHAARALKRGSIGFHQAGLHARGVTRAYVAKINAAMR